MTRYPYIDTDFGLVVLAVVSVLGLLLWLALRSQMLITAPVMTI